MRFFRCKRRMRVEHSVLMGAYLAGALLLATHPSGRAFAEEIAPAQLFHDYCSVCHGEKGDGDSRAQNSMIPPPRDFTTPQAATELTHARMLAMVREGKPGTAMPGWKTQLSDQEIVAVVDYIRERIMKPIATEEAEISRRLYAENCSVCHGDDGAGARWTQKNLSPPPRNFTHPSALKELTRDYMLNVVRHGKPDTAMPGFGPQLSQEDIVSVVDYVRAAFMPTEPLETEGSAQAANAEPSRGAQMGAGGIVDMSARMPRQLVGDPQRGMGMYLANCTTCHGIDGDGRGPRAYFILPKPRNFQHPGSRNKYNRPALFHAIARGKFGSEMPAWDTVLDDQEIANLAEYVFREFIQEGQDTAAVFEAVTD